MALTKAVVGEKVKVKAAKVEQRIAKKEKISKQKDVQ